MAKKETTVEKTQHEKIKEITDRLETGIQELFNSETYKSWLRTMSRFHNYSLNNTMLIHYQKPDASLVASYLSWQRNFGRQVNKGERGIRILAPAPYKKKIETAKMDPVTGEAMKNPDGSSVKDVKEVLVPSFKVVNVFDVSQTEGKELPTLGIDELTGSVQGYADFMEALKRSCPVPVQFENIAGGAKGYFHTMENRIALQKDMSEAQTVKTLIHEMAHQKLHSLQEKPENHGERMSRNRKEVEAESVAFTVSCRYGIDTSDYSFGYIAGWSEGKDTKELRESLDRIRKAADEMITDIDSRLEEIAKEREPVKSVLRDLKEKKEQSERKDKAAPDRGKDQKEKEAVR